MLLVGVDEMLEYMGVCRTTLYNWRNKLGLPLVKRGKMVMISTESYQQWMRTYLSIKDRNKAKWLRQRNALREHHFQQERKSKPNSRPSTEDHSGESSLTSLASRLAERQSRR